MLAATVVLRAPTEREGKRERASSSHWTDRGHVSTEGKMTDARGERVDTCVYLTEANWLVRFLVLMNVQQEEMERKNGQHRESDAWGVGTCVENMTEWQTTWCTLDWLFLRWVFPTLKATKNESLWIIKVFCITPAHMLSNTYLHSCAISRWQISNFLNRQQLSVSHDFSSKLFMDCYI